MRKAARGNWIHSALVDSIFILAPPFVATAVAIWFTGHSSQEPMSVSPWMWLLLVVGVDVAHVYSTLFRTYLDPLEFAQRKSLFVWAPLLTWLAGVVLYSVSALAFWRALAYLAAFHFVRQAYGFLMIYRRGEADVWPWERALDRATIYAATLYPLIHWHTHSREFDWLLAGDFFKFPWPLVGTITGVVYSTLLIAYAAKEVLRWRRTRIWNPGKNMILIGTAASWYVGIVHFNADLAFTVTNVVAHGIPYMALIWIHERKRDSTPQRAWRRFVFHPLGVPLFLGALILLGFAEEWLWDGFVWREHASVLPLADRLPAVRDGATLAWLVPLLALPQATHYVLDGFIWRGQGRANADPAAVEKRSDREMEAS